MTLFYKQYKSIQPWLQNENPPEKGTSFQLALLPSISDGTLPCLLQSSCNRLKTAASLMGCMSVFSARAALRLVPRTGGIRMNTLDLPLSCKPTDGSLTLGCVFGVCAVFPPDVHVLFLCLPGFSQGRANGKTGERNESVQMSHHLQLYAPVATLNSFND